ncbi:MAG: hypothetical protein C5B57_10515 [Blastocatellia bacterium]|nr:MAG: hypothetical protein C5B57_10515 [Blastocatellia bacterium]
MRTEAQQVASRENGAKGRGPVTPAGKARSAQNSLKHGLTAEQALIPGEDPMIWTATRDAYFRHWEPEDEVEADLVEAMFLHKWRLRRAAWVEASAIRRAMALQRLETDISGMASTASDIPDSDDFAAAFIELDQHGFVTQKLRRYEARHARRRKETMALFLEYRRLRLSRLPNEVDDKYQGSSDEAEAAAATESAHRAPDPAAHTIEALVQNEPKANADSYADPAFVVSISHRSSSGVQVDS